MMDWYRLSSDTWNTYDSMMEWHRTHPSRPIAYYATPEEALAIYNEDDLQSILVNPAGTRYAVGLWQAITALVDAGWRETCPEELETIVNTL